MDRSKKNKPKFYEIVVEGQIGDAWAEWFDGFAIEPRPNGTTVISGPVADQAVLHGILEKLRDLNCEIISLNQGGSHETSSS